MHRYTHIQKAPTESDRGPREGGLASHEITKQIEAYRLPSSNILSGCWDLQISLLYVSLMDISEESDDTYDRDPNGNDADISVCNLTAIAIEVTYIKC